MPPASGNVFLLKEGDGQGPEVFVTVAGLMGTTYAINGELVDTTNKGSNSLRDLLDGGGLKTLTISADGVYLGEAQQQNLRTRAKDGSLNNYQIDDGTEVVEGAFQVTSYNQDGPMNDKQTFSVTLESSGDWTVV